MCAVLGHDEVYVKGTVWSIDVHVDKVYEEYWKCHRCKRVVSISC